MKARNQDSICPYLIPLKRIYRTDLISKRLRRLSCTFYTDELFSKQKYIIGNTCAQIFTYGRIFKHMQTDKCNKATEIRLGRRDVEMAARCGKTEFSL